MLWPWAYRGRCLQLREFQKVAAVFQYGQTDNEMPSSRNSKKQIRYIKVPKITCGTNGLFYICKYVCCFSPKMLLLLKNACCHDDGHRDKNQAESTILVFVQVTQSLQDVLLLQSSSTPSLSCCSGSLCILPLHDCHCSHAHQSNSRKGLRDLKVCWLMCWASFRDLVQFFGNVIFLWHISTITLKYTLLFKHFYGWP